ncbi:hypothetical protein HKX23_16570 [Sulfitobacter sp. KE29]|uniref:lipopolysaccharide biosynthesis protein n=1 Tax=unclassified Sulfitobacter TaxID=196795 RepID=UPI0023E1C718|nr:MULTISPECIES: hypothetical protein [unclassified Sulfitobacter]MDF3419973.1 hypothetical protein [Sulfitobacter sp. Ks38]MDF3427457.1 hypothetical protein [Sulfitobacter sp. KE29]MDF3431037.1 hypothetical protein [Sulfitobacter sp. S46]MDF3445809.1 hypothetical protein [Sulfitobacter sp. KE31]MDF3549588.1 hypothetical protein [Sulfitobacter sp. KE28]
MNILYRIKYNQVLLRLLGGAGAGVIIKAGAAGLSLAMFTVLAWVTDAESFGVVGFCFSLATLLAVCGSFGQRMMSLKDAAIAHERADNQALAIIGKSSLAISFLGTSGMALLLVPVWALGGLQLDFWVFVAMVLLAVALAFAETAVHFFRGYRSVAFALLPRDILWRLAVIIACIAVLAMSLRLSAAVALWLLGLSLLLLTGLQALSASHMRSPTPVPQVTAAAHVRLRAGLPLWGTSLVQTVAGPVLAPVILGMVISPDEVGPFFAAFRIALVLDLFTLAAGMVVAPLVARGYANKNFAEVRTTLRYSVLMVSFATFVSFLVILFAGGWLLALMNPAFESAAPALTILGCGFLVSVCCGPVPNILELVGQEKLLLRRLAWFSGLCLLALVPAVHFYGMTGAALCIAGLRAAVHINLLLVVKRQIGIDPSIFSIFGNKP